MSTFLPRRLELFTLIRAIFFSRSLEVSYTSIRTFFIKIYYYYYFHLFRKTVRGGRNFTLLSIYRVKFAENTFSITYEFTYFRLYCSIAICGCFEMLVFIIWIIWILSNIWLTCLKRFKVIVNRWLLISYYRI